MVSAALFSSASDLWETPAEIFDPLNAEFGFTLDAAATSATRKCALYLGPDHAFPCRIDGLAADWRAASANGVVWVNPPYSRGLQSRFIAKAAAEAKRGVVVVMLLPARTDTKAFHRYVWNKYEHAPRAGVEVRFLAGRVRFVGAPASAPFPSMIVVFRR